MKEKIKKRLSYIMTHLTPHGPITARAMFGGYGIYWKKTIFATLVGETLYFRVNTSNEKDFDSYASKPFIYEGKQRRPVVLPYRELPEEILVDAKTLPKWIKKARTRK